MPKTAANTEQTIEKIKLLKPHRHAGRNYQAEAVLDLAALKMSQESAAWLIAIGTAEKMSD